jgi:hypothetical protein
MDDQGHIYRAIRAFDASPLGGRYIQTWRVEVDGQPLPRTDVAGRTSPRAWRWGYQQSAPTRLSHAILSYELGPEEAERLYQDFTHDLLAELAGSADDWTLTGRQIRDWLGTRRLLQSALDELDEDGGNTSPEGS